MSAASYDFPTIIRGNSPTFGLTMKDGDDPFDLTGSEIVFRATYQGTELIRKTTADSGLIMSDPVSGYVEIPLTVDETRLLPLGKLTTYEIERRIDGDEETLMRGKLTAAGGVNDDA